MKKTIISLAAAATIGLAALAPTAASAGHVGFGFAIQGDGFAIGVSNGGFGPFVGPHGHGHGHHKHCTKEWKKVWTPWGPQWKKVKECHWH